MRFLQMSNYITFFFFYKNYLLNFETIKTTYLIGLKMSQKL